MPKVDPEGVSKDWSRQKLGLPAEDFDFQYDTFEIMAAAREYYFGVFGPAIVARLRSLKQAYEWKYAVHGYKNQEQYFLFKI